MQFITTMVGAFARPEEARHTVRLLQPGDSVELRADPDNEYDDHAVACYKDGHHIGFIPRTDNGPLFDALMNEEEATAEVVGFENSIKPILEITINEDA